MNSATSQGALYNIGDGFTSRSVSSIDMDGERVFFITSGESFKKPNEIHLVEYLSLLGTATCQGVLTTEQNISKIIFDDKKTKKLFVCGKRAGSSCLNIVDRDIFNPKQVTCKEDTYRITKDMVSSKQPIDEQQAIEVKSDFSNFIFGYRDNNILAYDTDSVFLLDYEANKVVKNFKDIGEDVSKAALDPHYNRYAVSDNCDVVLLDERSSSDSNIVRLENCHAEEISAVDFNNNKNNTLLTSSYEQVVKIWDIRKPDVPLLVISDSNCQIEDAKFNPIYDQLLLFSCKDTRNNFYEASSGSISLYLANSVSSSLDIDLEMEEESNPDYLIRANEGCLGDSVYEIGWSTVDPWSFAGVSFASSVYFDIVPEEEKLKILL